MPFPPFLELCRFPMLAMGITLLSVTIFSTLQLPRLNPSRSVLYSPILVERSPVSSFLKINPSTEPLTETATQRRSRGILASLVSHSLSIASTSTDMLPGKSAMRSERAPREERRRSVEKGGDKHAGSS